MGVLCNTDSAQSDESTAFHFKVDVFLLIKIKFIRWYENWSLHTQNLLSLSLLNFVTIQVHIIHLLNKLRLLNLNRWWILSLKLSISPPIWILRDILSHLLLVILTLIRSLNIMISILVEVFIPPLFIVLPHAHRHLLVIVLIILVHVLIILGKMIEHIVLELLLILVLIPIIVTTKVPLIESIHAIHVLVASLHLVVLPNSIH
jgi:hypothetical protein